MNTIAGDILYRRVADRIQSMIEAGTFKAGDRVPSLRSLSSKLSVSVNTVREAYMVLESRGILEAKPQTGFFVLPPIDLPHHPVIKQPRPTRANVREIIYEVLTDNLDPEITSLAVAVTDPLMLPLAELERAIVHSVRYNQEAAMRYQFDPDTEELRTQIAIRMLDSDVQVRADQLAITSGGLEAVSLALSAICKTGDTIAIESPTYFVFFRLAEAMGLNLVEIPTSPSTGMNLDVLEYVLSEHSIKAIVCTPNFSNPTGSLMPDELKERLVQMAASREVPIIEDGVYGELYFRNTKPSALASFDREGNVVYCSSFSKTIAPGLRLGWVMGGRRHDTIQRLKVISSISAAAPSVQSVTSLLQTGRYDRHLRRLRRGMQANMLRLIGVVLESFPAGTRITRPGGGLSVWVELPKEIDTLRLYTKAREENISLAVGPMFTLSRDFHQFLRLSAGQLRGDEERALRSVGAMAHAMMI